MLVVKCSPRLLKWVSFVVVWPQISRGFVREDVYFSPPPRPVTAPPAPGGDGKTTLAPPGGCGRGGGGGRQRLAVKENRRGKGANFIPTAANRGVAFLFGHSPVSVPFDQFLLPHRRRLLSPSPFSLSAAAAPAPLAPASPGPPRAAGQKVARMRMWTFILPTTDGRMWHLKQLHPPCDQTGVHTLGMTSDLGSVAPDPAVWSWHLMAVDTKLTQDKDIKVST
ncbi:uncharacterized protein LOC123849663 [Mirounga angustirostris]|uniref:uncharacterized protein LOC123849663 n=1 Tax=Mirounga angustirostris TaxID=9716 RepID=UPI0023E37360|nr:uncharacterized protein LOC123849663 [Mirounga angustirostris]